MTATTRRGHRRQPLRPPHGRRLLGRLRRWWAHRSVKAVTAGFAVLLCWVAFSVGQALAAPGNTGTSARLAEWARDHYLGPVVTFGEWISYNPPKVGGKPQFSLTAPSSAAGAGINPRPASKPRPGSSASPAAADVPARLTSPAGSPLPGEGQWRVVASVRGVPAIYTTYLRPDRVHTSYVAALASMDPRLLTFQLRPGSEDPGPASWGYAPYLPSGSRPNLLASFNGGFKINQAGGGFYLNGITRARLTRGAASMVYYRDGRVAIGTWGRDVRMTTQILGVRQNLKLIVDHGAIPASVDENVQTQWGATLGGGYYVWRSGIGVTRDGRVVYAYGPALSVRTLAGLLQRAGAVRAMELDINPAWTSYMYYKPAPSAADPSPVNLLPTQQEPADRYFSVNSRDFTAVFAR